MIWPSRILRTCMCLFVVGCTGDDRPSTGDSTSGADTRAELDCAVPAGDVQIEGGAGVLRIGSTVADLRGRCRVVRDTIVPDNEGMPSRELTIALGGDRAIAELVGDSVWRLRFTSPRFRSGNVRVGTTVAELERFEGARALVGEGEVYVTLPET